MPADFGTLTNSLLTTGSLLDKNLARTFEFYRVNRGRGDREAVSHFRLPRSTGLAP